MVVALAAAAGLAIDNARLHDSCRASLLLEDRERIARDLHDDVIQRLFAAGMSLQTTMQLTDDERLRRRLETTLADLDTVIVQVRNTIFHLSREPGAGPSVRADVLDLCAEAAARWGSTRAASSSARSTPPSARVASTCCSASARRCPTSCATPTRPRSASTWRSGATT